MTDLAARAAVLEFFALPLFIIEPAFGQYAAIRR
jgi:hypothetical protein